MGRPLREPKNERGRRLREARGEMTVEQLAREAGTAVATIYQYEAGIVMPRADILARIAEVTGRSSEWLMATSDKVKDVSDYELAAIPMVGRGGAGRGEFSVDGFPTGQGWRRVARPSGLRDPNAFAVEVVGNSMEPRYFNKEIVVCSPRTEWKSGDFCVVKTKEGEYLIKRLKKEEKHLILSSLAPGHEPILLPLKDVAGVYKIVWHKEN